MRKVTDIPRAAARPHDPFTFSLDGITTVASFLPLPVIATDRINVDRDDREPRRRIAARRA